MGKKKSKKKIATKKQRSDAERRISQAARVGDCLRLLQFLLGRSRWDTKLLAERFECSERTIYRRLDVLELAGVPYFYDRELKCIRVQPGAKFSVPQLTADELLEQATSTVVGNAQGLSVAMGDANYRKLAATSSDEVAELLADAERVMVALDLKLADHSKHKEILKTIQWALIEQKRVVGSYKSPYQEKTLELKLAPLRLCLTGQAWYVIATTAASVQPKTYRVMRFQTARLLDGAADVPEDFDIDEYFGNAWGVFRGEETYDVELLFTAAAVELVTETTWHKTQKVERHADGSATLKFTVDGLDEIVWWVLGWSGRVTVCEPIELRQMVNAQLQEALKQNSVE